MTGRSNPWRSGDLNDLILKFSGVSATPTVQTLELIREIHHRLDLIENEDRRRQAAKVASDNFRKRFSHEQ
jgi:hypothetical protein